MAKSSVTIKDIAKEAGVSTTLVSFVMSNQVAGEPVYRVGEDTARRVMEVAERLQYKPNNTARALRSGKTLTIGVVVSDIANPFFAEIARDLEDQAYKYGYNVIFGSSDENPEKFGRVVDVLLNKGVDGLILVPCAGSEDAIRKVVGSGVDTVLLDREVPGLQVSSVVLDNREAARVITRKLLDRGARRIDMVSYSMNISNTRDREQGYLDAIKEAGPEFETHIERITHNSYDSIPSYFRSARERGVDAFMMATNTLALLVMSEIYKNGYHIPDDFKVACFDRNPLYDIYAPGIIFVRQPVDSFAARAMELIMARIRSGPGRKVPIEQIVLSPEISG
ncbi:MAG: LacI family DNA-binding transcriptional regulator [Bacteroidales bacterium]|nr:LacI family DNA-binding transcriptional regulator [Bacteroidales bacterium]